MFFFLHCFSTLRCFFHRLFLYTKAFVFLRCFSVLRRFFLHCLSTQKRLSSYNVSQHLGVLPPPPPCFSTLRRLLFNSPLIIIVIIIIIIIIVVSVAGAEPLAIDVVSVAGVELWPPTLSPLQVSNYGRYNVVSVAGAELWAVMKLSPLQILTFGLQRCLRCRC